MKTTKEAGSRGGGATADVMTDDNENGRNAMTDDDGSSFTFEG